MIQTVFWAGNVLGCFLWGFCNDRFGRKTTIFWSHLVYFLGNLGTCVVPVLLRLVAHRGTRRILTVSLLSLLLQHLLLGEGGEGEGRMPP